MTDTGHDETIRKKQEIATVSFGGKHHSRQGFRFRNIRHEKASVLRHNSQNKELSKRNASRKSYKIDRIEDNQSRRSKFPGGLRRVSDPVLVRKEVVM